MPLISVLTTTYNREDMVKRAIESVLRQTMKDFELVVVDNGSQDGSGEVAEEYAKQDGRVRVVHLFPNQGAARGHNAAYEHAYGKYVTYLDDDDWVEPDFLEFLYNLTCENDADIAICGSRGRRARNFDIKKVMSGEEAILELLARKRINSMPGTKLFRRDLMDDLRFPPEYPTGHDAAIMYRIFSKADRVAYHGLPKYVFGGHADNTSAWMDQDNAFNKDILAEKLRIYRERKVWLTERYPHHTKYFQYVEWSFMLSMTEKVNRLRPDGCMDLAKYMHQELTQSAENILCSPWLQDFEKQRMQLYIL